MGNAQEKALGTEKFRQNQVLFRKYTAVDEALKSVLSQRWNHSSYPHCWIRSQGSDRYPHSPWSNTCSPVTGRLTKSTSRRTQWRWWGPTTPQNPLPDWLNNWKGEYNLRNQENRPSPMPLWCPKGLPSWFRQVFSTTTSVSGDVRPRTRRRGPNTSYFPQSPPRAEKSSNNRRQRSLHRDGTKLIWWTTSPSIRQLLGNIVRPYNIPGRANTELRTGRNGTIQCSPYHFELSSNGTVGTYDCDHERHAGEIEYTRSYTKKQARPKSKHYFWSYGSNYTHGRKT